MLFEEGDHVASVTDGWVIRRPRATGEEDDEAQRVTEAGGHQEGLLEGFNRFGLGTGCRGVLRRDSRIASYFAIVPSWRMASISRRTRSLETS